MQNYEDKHRHTSRRQIRESRVRARPPRGISLAIACHRFHVSTKMAWLYVPVGLATQQSRGIPRRPHQPAIEHCHIPRTTRVDTAFQVIWSRQGSCIALERLFLLYIPQILACSLLFANKKTTGEMLTVTMRWASFQFTCLYNTFL
jgi:hypothetical protein